MMQRLVVNTLAIVLIPASIGLGQQPGAPPGPPQPGSPGKSEKAKKPAEKSKLEEMLAQALKNNPDIRVAAAKVAKADAELNRTRLQVTQEVVALYYAIDSQKKTVKHQERKLGTAGGGYKSGQIDSLTFLDAQQALALAKAKLAELEAQLPALLGKAAYTAYLGGAVNMKQTHLKNVDLTNWEFVKVAEPRPGPLAERIHKALQTPIKVEYKDVKLSEVLKDLEKKAPGLSFHIRDVQSVIIRESGGRASSGEPKVTLHFDTPLPISAILQAIEDEVGSSFIVRDYGILVTSRELPRGAMTVHEFMRHKPAEK